MNNYLFLWTLCSVLVVAGADEVYAAAGQFQFVAGTVKVVNRTGVERAAKKGMDVDEGDTVSTSANSLAQIRMVDGGFIAVRADSRLKVEMFVFNGKEDGQERSLIMLLKGGFRAITGLIGNQNKQNYLIKTPTATIGVRGTDHEPMFIPQPVAGGEAAGVPGTYDKVNIGAAFIKTDFGIININPNQVGFVAGADKVPQLLPKIPEFYKSAPEKSLPADKSDARSLKGGGGNLGSRDATGTPLKLAPTTLNAPTTLKISPTTSLIAPTTTLKAPATTLIAPTTTQIAPATTIIAPTTTLIAPTTTLIAPTTTLIAPTTTLVAPTTTLIAPTTILVK